MARRSIRPSSTTPKQHKDHTGVVWFTLGIVLVVVYSLFALLGQHPTLGDTHTPLWFGVLIGFVMIVFGLIGMTKRRHPGHI